jgi:heme exporter protein C
MLKALLVLTAALVAVSNYLVFVWVPNEAVMGPVQRIFYFHFGAAIATYLCMFGVLIASLGFLSTGRKVFDSISTACGEVGLLTCSIVMFTGMIWGQVAWNTPFRWEPRLVTLLFLLLIYISFVALRTFGDGEKLAKQSAVLGVLGALTVPAVMYSIHLLPQFAQLHPVVVERRGLREESFRTTMMVCMIAMISLSMLLIVVRTKIAELEKKFQTQG